MIGGACVGRDTSLGISVVYPGTTYRAVKISAVRWEIYENGDHIGTCVNRRAFYSYVDQRQAIRAAESQLETR